MFTTSEDTFAGISRKAYGTEVHARAVARANPGLTEPIPAGTDVYTPAIPDAPTDRLTAATANDANEVAVLIDGQRFRFWTELRIVRALDVVDSIELVAPFNPDDPSHRATFQPFSFKPLVVTVGGAPLFTGTLVAVTPALDADSRVVTLSGYALPGVLNDCTPPASAYPVEFEGGLSDITKALCDPFGLSVVFSADEGAAFERVAASPSESVLSFLAELARQRALVISSTPTGGLLVQNSVPTGNPVALLTESEPPLLSVAPSFSPQAYHSHITALAPTGVGTDGDQYTVKNPHLSTLRPSTFVAPDVEGGEIKQAAEAKAARMFGNMASYTIRVATWRDPSGQLWAPNTTLKLTAPGAMVYAPYEFVVRSVLFDATSTSEVAELTLVLPGAFAGQLPEALPWDL